MSLNKVMLIGNLGQDPDLRRLESGKAVATLSVATNEKWTDQAGKKHEKVEWHRVIVWEKLAENCAQYLQKGRSVYVEGTLATRKWQDKTGADRWTTEINARTVQFLGGGQGGGGARPPHPGEIHGDEGSLDNELPQQGGAPFTEDDIPF